jgi:hypothetical protein
LPFWEKSFLFVTDAVLFLFLDRTVQISYQESAPTIVGIFPKTPLSGQPVLSLAISTGPSLPIGAIASAEVDEVG